MNKQRGNISIVQVITWGVSISLAISTFVGSVLWTKTNATDNELAGFKAKVADDKAIYTADIASMKTDISNIKEVVNRIDRKIK